jgi:hypothetical protein
MRRIATIAALAALFAGLPLIEASAGEGYRYGRRAYAYYPSPYNSYAYWRAYYRAQADLSFARRAYRANYFVVRGYNPPSRYFRAPTNYYAEQYALDPYAYFNCPLARRGEGVCADLPPLSAVP